MVEQLRSRRLLWALALVFVVHLSGFQGQVAARFISSKSSLLTANRHDIPHRRLSAEATAVHRRSTAAATNATLAPSQSSSTASDPSLCINVQIVYVGSPQLGESLFTTDICDAAESEISNTLTRMAAFYELGLSSPFALTRCEDKLISVCGGFGDVAAAAEALQVQLQMLASMWLEASLDKGGPCAPKWSDNQFVVTVESEEQRPLAQYTPSCDIYIEDSMFPKHSCNHKAYATPFAISKATEEYSTQDGQATGYCFTVRTVPPTNPKGACGRSKMVLKMEFFANATLRRNLTAVRLREQGPEGGDRAVVASWAVGGQNLMRVLGLKWDMAVIKNAPQVCLELSAGVSLADFCAGGLQRCFVWLYDRSLNCCPQYSAL